MSCRWRAIIALILLLALPLRAIAVPTASCCPAMVEPSHGSIDATMHHTMDVAMGGAMDAAMDHEGDAAANAAHPDDPHPTFACCTIAMIALPMQPVVVPRYVPPQAMPMRPPSVAHFVTDAPDRPPRIAPLMV